MPQVVVAGHVCLDIIPRFNHPAELSPGSLIEVGNAELATGGCVSNVGRALHRLGIDVQLLGKIGDDPFGQILRDVLAKEDVSLGKGLVVNPGGHTSYSVVINRPGIDRTFLHMPGENDTFCAADVDPSEFIGARVFHLGYPPLLGIMYRNEGEELVALLRKVHAAGIPISLDMSLPDPSSESGRAPWKRILEKALPFVTFFFPGDAELRFMLGAEDDEEVLIRRCLEMGASRVVLKKGDRGLATLEDGNLLRHPCFCVDVAGTTGSGDATVAGFLMGVARGFNLDECLEAACAVGACSVEAVDSISGIQSWPATKARIESGWEKR